MPGSQNPCQNHLLAALPADESTRIFPRLELVPMPLGEALCESGIPMRRAGVRPCLLLSPRARLAGSRATPTNPGRVQLRSC